MGKPEEFIEQLNSLANIVLPEDPTEAGFSKINQALATIQNNNTQATRIIVQAAADRAGLRRVYTAKRYTMDLKRKMLLATDEEVKAGKNAGEREALAEMKMVDEIKEHAVAEQNKIDADAIVAMADHTLAMLKTAKEIAGHMLGVADKEIHLGLINKDNIK